MENAVLRSSLGFVNGGMDGESGIIQRFITYKMY